MMPEPPREPSVPSPQDLSVVDRYGVHPILFAFGCLAFIFVTYQFGGALIALVLIGTTNVTRENVNLVRWLTMGGQVALIFVPTLLLGRLLSRNGSEVFRLRNPSAQEITLAVIGLLALQRVFDAYSFFQDKFPIPQSLRHILGPVKEMFDELLRTIVRAESVPELLVVILIVAIVPAVVEETMFRGLIQSAFNRALMPSTAAVVTGIIFALFHLNPFELVPLVGLGCYLGFLRYRSETLILPVVVHGLNNLLAILAVYFHMDDSGPLLDNHAGLPEVVSMILQALLFGAIFVISFSAYYRATRSVVRSSDFRETTTRNEE
ncbi:MAG TPA: CPBP family intramembrane glutamic endopeptidase [Bacteroidota bacterium]|nr:CPBP family intramembrane glutamic endopeptidase [Bacteroidota bacterium]